MPLLITNLYLLKILLYPARIVDIIEPNLGLQHITMLSVNLINWEIKLLIYLHAKYFRRY